MTRPRGQTFALGVVILLVVTVGAVPSIRQRLQSVAGRDRQPTVAAGLGHLKLAFEPNLGQAGAGTDFMARGVGYEAHLSPRGLMLSLAQGEARSELSLVFEGAEPAGRLHGLEQAPGRTNYLVGSNPDNWITDVANYERVRHEGAYPGIDVVYYGTRSAMEYDFVVAPGADPSPIAVRVEGASGLRVDGDGDLVATTAAGDLRQRHPVAFQQAGDGSRRPVDARYDLTSATARILLGPYDRSRALVIDPIIEASTYLGGQGFEYGADMDIDAEGNVYVTGHPTSSFPTTAGGFIRARGGGGYVTVVAKLDATLSRLVYSTYLVGTNRAESMVFGMAVDADGFAHVTGAVTHGLGGVRDFPVTPEAFDDCTKTFAGSFVTKLNQKGNGLEYSTCIPAVTRAIAVGPSGEVWVGGTAGADFPVTQDAAQSVLIGPSNTNGVVARFDTTRSGSESLAYASYFEGDSGAGISTLAVDGEGNLYAGGGHASGEHPFPGNGALLDCAQGQTFLAKLSPSGQTVYGVCPGGVNVSGVAIDSAGNAYATGWAFGGAPAAVTPSGYRQAPVSADKYLVKIDPTGTKLLYGTYLGGSGSDQGGGSVEADDDGHVWLGAQVHSLDMALKNAPLAFEATSYEAGMLVEIDTTKAGEDSLVFATRLAGVRNGAGVTGVALAPGGNLVVFGGVSAQEFPLGSGGYQDIFAGRDDMFVTQVKLPPRVAGVSPASVGTCGGGQVSITGTRLGGAEVRFDGVTSVPTVLDDGQIQVQAPAHAPGPVNLEVSAPWGSASVPFTYDPIPIPVIDSIRPVSGPVEGGTEVVVTGSGLGCVASARFGATPAASIQLVSDGEVRLVSPPGTRGPVDVVLNTGAGGPESMPVPGSRFTYLAIPKVNSVTPACGPAEGGTQVLLQGTSLSGTTSVRFGSATAPVAIPMPGPDTGLAVVTPALPSGVHDVIVTTVDGPSVPGVIFSVACGTTVGEPDPGVGPGGLGPDATPEPLVIPPGGATPGPGLVDSPGLTSASGLGSGPPAGPGLAGAPVAGGLPGAVTAPAAQVPVAPVSGVQVSAAPSSGSASAAPALPAAPVAGVSGLVTASPTATPNPAGAPGLDPVEPATRHAMVARSGPDALPTAMGISLLLILGCLGITVNSHLRSSRRRCTQPAWARAQ